MTREPPRERDVQRHARNVSQRRVPARDGQLHRHDRRDPPMGRVQVGHRRGPRSGPDRTRVMVDDDERRRQRRVVRPRPGSRSVSRQRVRGRQRQEVVGVQRRLHVPDLARLLRGQAHVAQHRRARRRVPQRRCDGLHRCVVLGSLAYAGGQPVHRQGRRVPEEQDLDAIQLRSVDTGRADPLRPRPPLLRPPRRWRRPPRRRDDGTTTTVAATTTTTTRPTTTTAATDDDASADHDGRHRRLPRRPVRSSRRSPTARRGGLAGTSTSTTVPTPTLPRDPVGTNTWNGDHATNCEGPDLSRTLNAGGDRSQHFYRCAPFGKNDAAHVMTSMGDVDGYSTLSMAPQQTFPTIRKVCWDQNVTDLGGRTWTEVLVVPGVEGRRRRPDPRQPRVRRRRRQDQAAHRRHLRRHGPRPVLGPQRVRQRRPPSRQLVPVGPRPGRPRSHARSGVSTASPTTATAP